MIKTFNRILIVSNRNQSLAEGRVGLLNVLFCCQKQMIQVDVIEVQKPKEKDNHSLLLQQAAYITNGLYFILDHPNHLFSLLTTIGLYQSEKEKEVLRLPNRTLLDFTTNCFCHPKKLVQLAHVCSVCLTIYCKETVEKETKFQCFQCQSLLQQ